MSKNTPTAKKTQASLTSFFKKTPQALGSDACGDITNVSRKPTAKTFTPPVRKADEKRAEAGREESDPVISTPKTAPSASKDEDSPGSKATSEPRRKRRRVILSDSDDEEGKVDAMDADSGGSDDEYKPTKEDSDGASSDEGPVEEVEEDLEDIGKIKAAYKPNKSSSKLNSDKKVPSVFLTPRMGSTPNLQRTGSYTPKSKGLSSHSKSLLSSYNAEDSFNESVVEEMTDDFVNYKHTGFAFLQPENLRDGEKRKMDDPDYDPRTLHIPPDFLKKQTPGHQQWWKFKALHFDTILMFKVGKFYELYHMDAELAVRELNLTYMKGDYAHCGFPEIAYGRFADQLVQRGFKVARIEQVETPTQLEERRKSRGSIGPVRAGEKVVQRELCRITTPGTLTHSHMDVNAVQKASGDNSPEKSSMDTSQATSESSQSSSSNRQFHSRLLVAFCEKMKTGNLSTYGICFVDTSIGVFKLAQFDDDAQRTTLRTLLAHHPPSQVLLERGKVSSQTDSVLRTLLAGNVSKESLSTKSEFLSAEEALKRLVQPQYLGPFMSDSGEKTWPATLCKMVDTNDPLGKTPRSDCTLALSSLGAIMWYLKLCLIDTDIVSMRNFEDCVLPPRLEGSSESDGPPRSPVTVWTEDQLMVLDGMAIENLKIVPCDFSVQGSEGKSLYQRVDFCQTPFGKRLLRQWLCSPLCNIEKIKERQDAVAELRELTGFRQSSRELLPKLPDLEVLLQKIHTLGSLYRAQHHPESKAVMFETDKYNKRKIMSLQAAINGFKDALKIVDSFSVCNNECPSPKSPLLRRCLANSSDGFPPDLREYLEDIDNSFDHEKALKDGVVIPQSGRIPDFDLAVAAVRDVEDEFHQYLVKQKRALNCMNIQYFGSGKNRYQMEIPEAVAAKLSDDYISTSQRKGFKRFTTVELKEMMDELQKAEDKKTAVLRDIMRMIFAKFDERYMLWKRGLECIATIDVLLSFCRYADSCNSDVSLPQFGNPLDNKPFLEIVNGYHPCLMDGTSSGEFIPNDVSLGLNTGNLLLLTGPNMGGKSTLMRQCALLTIMAQMGMLVPAASMRLTPVDRIFTRIGANDRLLAGESTFYVEMNETNQILRNATKHSLIVMDELGRGTGTFDGTAIAFAVLKDLSERINARTFFSTHYHSLVSDFAENPSIDLRHMACMVENECDDDPTEETVTFLYKLVKGPCPKSYGFFAAKLAGVLPQVVKNGHVRSAELTKLQAKLRNLFTEAPSIESPA